MHISLIPTALALCTLSKASPLKFGYSLFAGPPSNQCATLVDIHILTIGAKPGQLPYKSECIRDSGVTCIKTFDYARKEGDDVDPNFGKTWTCKQHGYLSGDCSGDPWQSTANVVVNSIQLQCFDCTGDTCTANQF